jgi:GT2 family glycosyltransferase
VKNALELPGALVGAIRRNGVRNIAIFAGGMLRKRGLWGTARYALLTASGRADTVDAPPPISPYAPTSDQDLDSRYALPIAKWRERLSRMREAQEADPAPSLDPLPELGVVLLASPGAKASDLPRTLEALARSAVGLATPLSVFIADPSWPVQDHPGLRIVGSTEQLPGTADAWILYLGIGDVPLPHFLHAVAPAMRTMATLVITVDLFREEGGLAFPLLLPGANPVLARHVDYGFSRLMLRSALTRKSDAAVDQPRALLVEWLEARPSPDARARWRHVFEPLVEARLSHAEVADAITPPALVRVDAEPRVSIVICTKDKGHLLRQLSRTLLSEDTRIADLVIVSNNTTSPHALETLRGLADHPKVKILIHDAPFNFSRLSNLGAAAASGDFLLFLNDDIVPVSDDWLGALLAPFHEDPAVGVSGPLLLYPDERIQHAGMYLGYHGMAGHTLRHGQSPQDDYLFYTTAPREVSALTGAAMLVSRACFDALNGFDELLATHLQDVDFSLRAKHSGFVNVFEPRAVLIHMESVSVRPMVAAEGKSQQRHRELQYFLARWGDAITTRDDLHNPAFALDDEGLRNLS